VSTVELTSENFGEMVRSSDVLLMDFWASWCGPCRNFAPVYESAAEQHTDVVFGTVDTEAQQELAQAFQIRSIPTLVAMREGVVLYAQPGGLSGPALDDLIGKVRAIDMDEVRAKIAEQAS